MKRNFFTGLSILLFVSCNQDKKSVQTTKEVFDKIESINWCLQIGSLLMALNFISLFSRIGDVHANSYQFKIIKRRFC